MSEQLSSPEIDLKATKLAELNEHVQALLGTTEIVEPGFIKSMKIDRADKTTITLAHINREDRAVYIVSEAGIESGRKGNRASKIYEWDALQPLQGQKIITREIDKRGDFVKTGFSDENIDKIEALINEVQDWVESGGYVEA